jgi:hypothetical protein
MAGGRWFRLLGFLARAADFSGRIYQTAFLRKRNRQQSGGTIEPQ